MNKKEFNQLNNNFPQYVIGNPVYIYGLTDPETGQIRYIGKSIRPIERLSNHCNEKSNCHRSNWIQSLKAKGLKPGLVILERIVGDWPWQESEKYWIAYGRKNGWNLVNNTDGGDGVVNISGDSKLRMKLTWLGRKHKPESLIKIGIASKGRKHSNDTKLKMSIVHKNRKITWGNKISDAARKINKEQVINIQKELFDGCLVKDIASKYQVHRTTISKIKKGVYFEK